MAKNKRIHAVWRNIDESNEQVVVKDVGNIFTYGMTAKDVLTWMKNRNVTHVDWQDSNSVGKDMPGGMKNGMHTIGEIAAFLNVRKSKR
jgi:hypothetical protein